MMYDAWFLYVRWIILLLVRYWETKEIKKNTKIFGPLKKKGAMYIELKSLNIYEALRFPCDRLGLHR